MPPQDPWPQESIKTGLKDSEILFLGQNTNFLLTKQPGTGVSIDMLFYQSFVHLALVARIKDLLSLAPGAAHAAGQPGFSRLVV